MGKINFVMGEILKSGDNGEDLIGCAVETFPIKWRVLAALEDLDSNNIAGARDMLKDVIREIHRAERTGAPLPRNIEAELKATCTP